METTTFKNKGMTVAALLLVLPTAYFILISILKYSLGVDGPFDTASPILESLGIQESLGWNINLLILFGPLIAFMLCIFQILKINWQIERDTFSFNFSIKKKWFPLSVVIFSIGILAILFFYFLIENYRHP
jgi:hypothetical protein